MAETSGTLNDETDNDEDWVGGRDIDEKFEEESEEDVEEDNEINVEEDTEEDIGSDVGQQDAENIGEDSEQLQNSEKPEVAKKFKFYISPEEWASLKVLTCRRGSRRLAKGWSNLFYKKVREQNLTCPMVFQKNYIRKEDSRKAQCTFLTAKAVCKFEGCVQYEFKIKREPKPEKAMKVRVCPIMPHNIVTHSAGVKKARFISGEERAEISEEIRKKGPSNVYYELLGSVEEESLKAGNTSGVGSKRVIQKISSEINVMNKLHKDVILEVALLKKVYEKEDHTENIIKGCIQRISFCPFSVMIYSGQQLSILAKKIAERTAILYFDATGKVLSKIPGQPKRMLYYPLLLKGQDVGDPPVPVAEYITNSHGTVDISHFLMTFLRDLNITRPNSKLPVRIEVDYSWALIHGILIACNRENISTYLKRAWKHVHNEIHWQEQTRIHICSAHLLHKVASHLSSVIKEKRVRRYILFVVARMIDARNIADIEKCFTGLCVVLLSQSRNSHPDFDEAKLQLDQIVDTTEDEVVGENLEISLKITDTDDTHGSKPSKSAFGCHFQAIADQVRSDITDSLDTPQSEKHLFHHPSVIQYLLGSYMGILPLWTGILLEERIKHDTNSPAENWMKIVKHDILHGKSRMSPTDFIIEMRHNLRGRLIEYADQAGICTNKNRLSCRKLKRKSLSKSNRNSFIHSEEKWGGKKPKKGIYFHPPRSGKDETRNTEHALHWGGILQTEERSIRLANTCPVDNLLVFICFLLQRKNIRDWFEANSNSVEVCKTLLQIADLFLSKRWPEGRGVWLLKYGTLPEGDHWDIFGSEWERFVQHFAPIQETRCESVCSKRRCQQKQRTIVSREILLGDQIQRTSTVFQECINQWEDQSKTPCLAGHHRCHGERTCSRRRFLHPDPPILILNVTFLSERRGLKSSHIPETVIVTDKRYRLFGFTVGDGIHFKGYFRREASWMKYDGLCTPEVTRLSPVGDSAQIEHVVFFRED